MMATSQAFRSWTRRYGVPAGRGLANFSSSPSSSVSTSSNGGIGFSLTKEQLEAQPAYDETGYAENRDTMRMVVPN